VSLLGGLDTRQVSFWCQTRGKSLCADAEDKYHIGGGVFAGASCELLEALTVPDLVGMLRRDAENLLRASGFTECTTALCRGDQWIHGGEIGADDPGELGKVADQYPAAGTTVPSTLEVPGVRFWIGMPLVPDVLGLTAAEASAEIARWHLRTSQVGTEPTSDPALVGKVVRQSPPAGELVDIGIRVSYWVGTASTGTTDTTSGTTPTSVTLKNYSGWQCAAARADLQALGLVAPACEFAWYVPYDSPSAGAVDSQEPAPGTTVARGSTVQLWAYEVATTLQTCNQAAGYWGVKSVPCGDGWCEMQACWSTP
jgi:beta-lactam-binding protein with PASTA domain